MAQYIEVIGVGQVEFPDGMSKDEMAAALSKLPKPQAPTVEATTTPTEPVAPAAPTEDFSKPAFLTPKPFRKDQAVRTRAEEVKKEEAAKIPFNQLYEDDKNFNTIFEYAKARFGKEGVPIAGETKEDYVKRFATHMRMLDMGNELNAVGELQYLNNAKKEDVLKAGAAYDLFKNTAGYFDKGGQSGFRPVIDAIGSIVSSPSTALTLGVGKLATSSLSKMITEKGVKGALTTAKGSAVAAATPVAEAATSAAQNVTQQKIDLDVVQAQVNKAKEIMPTLDPESQAKLTEQLAPLEKQLAEGVSGKQAAVAGAVGTLGGALEVGPLLLASKTGKAAKPYNLSDVLTERSTAKGTPTQTAAPKVEVPAVKDPTEKALEDAYDIFEGRKLLDEQGSPTAVAQMQVRTDLNKKATIIAQDIWKQLPDYAPKVEEKVSDAIKRTFENVDTIDDLVFERALASADVTPDEFAKMFRTSAGDAARTLQSLSVVARLQNKLRAIDPAAAKELDAMYGERHAITSAFVGLRDLGMRVDRELKALMVSQVATTVRNAFSGAAVVTFGAASEAFESALYRMGKTAGELSSGQPITGSFTGGIKGVYDDAVRTAFYLGQQELSSDVTEALLKGTPALYRKMVKTTGETEAKNLSKPAQLANTLNVAQDAFFRKAIFTATVEKQLSRVGLNMYDLIEQGKAIPFDVLRNAVDASLEATFSKMPTKGPLFHAVKFVEELGPIGSTVIPFPRFMANAMTWTYKHSPAGLLSGTADIAAGAMKLGKGEADALGMNQMTQGLENFSKGAVGTAAIYAAYKYRQENQDGNWYDVKNPDGSLVDARALFPAAPYLALGDYLVKLENARTDEFKAKEFIEALIGFKAPAGTYSWLGDKFAEAQTNAGVGEATADMKVKTFFGEWLGEYFGRALVPLQQVSDLVGAIDRDETLPRDAYQIPAGEEGVVSSATQQLMKRTPVVKQQLPVYQPATKEEAKFNDAGPLKMFTGIAVKGKPSALEEEITRLHVPNNKIFTSTGDKIVDAEARKIMAPLFVQQFDNISKTDYYKTASKDMQKIVLQNLASWAQSTAKEWASDTATAQAYNEGKQPRLFEVKYSRLAPEVKREVTSMYKANTGLDLEKTKDYAAALAYAESIKDLPGFAAGGDVTGVMPLSTASLFEKQYGKLTSKNLQVIKTNFRESYGREFNPATDQREAVDMAKEYGLLVAGYNTGGLAGDIAKGIVKSNIREAGNNLMKTLGELTTKTTTPEVVQQTEKLLAKPVAKQAAPVLTPAEAPRSTSKVVKSDEPYLGPIEGETRAVEPSMEELVTNAEASFAQPAAFSDYQLQEAEKLLKSKMGSQYQLDAYKKEDPAAYQESINKLAAEIAPNEKVVPVTSTELPVKNVTEEIDLPPEQQQVTNTNLNKPKFAVNVERRNQTMAELRTLRTDAFNTLKEDPTILEKGISPDAIAVAQGDWRIKNKRELDITNPTDVQDFTAFAEGYQKKLEALREQYKDRPPVVLYHGSNSVRTEEKLRRGFFRPQDSTANYHKEIDVGAPSFTKDLRLNYNTTEFGGNRPDHISLTEIPYADYLFRRVDMPLKEYQSRDMNIMAQTITGSPEVARPLGLPRSLNYRETEDAFLEADKLKMRVDIPFVEKQLKRFEEQDAVQDRLYKEIAKSRNALNFSIGTEKQALAANKAYSNIRDLLKNEVSHTTATTSSEQTTLARLEAMSKSSTLRLIPTIEDAIEVLRRNGAEDKAATLEELRTQLKVLQGSKMARQSAERGDVIKRNEAVDNIRALIGGERKVPAKVKDSEFPASQYPKNIKRLGLAKGGLASRR